ncbi:hypothetical protein [Veronia nyctiphanis]|uniref:hypothetical protein n=1 Tax=Veronia nyctiphanis TaxID=1278244 RepID=UPI00100B5769|nr:hypothetical protein [Veronia nyctiphanis]
MTSVTALGNASITANACENTTTGINEQCKVTLALNALSGENQETLSIQTTHPQAQSFTVTANYEGLTLTANELEDQIDIEDIRVFSNQDAWQTDGELLFPTTVNSKQKSVLMVSDIDARQFHFDVSIDSDSPDSILNIYLDGELRDSVKDTDNAYRRFEFSGADTVALEYIAPNGNVAQTSVKVRDFAAGSFAWFLLALASFALVTRNRSE